MINVYCDGSIYPNPGGPEGWAFTAVDVHGEITEDSGGTVAAPGNSNNRAELRALMLALLWLNGREATIFSDSQYVCMGMNVWTRKWVTNGWHRREKNGARVQIPNRDLWELAIPLRTGNQIIEWVRGHAGTYGNERADRLAEEARLSVTIQPRSERVLPTITIPGELL